MTYANAEKFVRDKFTHFWVDINGVRSCVPCAEDNADYKALKKLIDAGKITVTEKYYIDNKLGEPVFEKQIVIAAKV